MNTSNLRAYLFLTITAMCWGANAIFGRLLVGEASPLLVVALRWLIVIAVLLIIARPSIRRDWPVLRRHSGYIVLMGTMGYTVFNALFYIAAHSTTAINIGIIQGAVPVFVLIGAFFVFRTRVTVLQLIGVLITMLGVVVVGAGGEWQRLAALAFTAGDSLIFIACISYAAYAVGLRKRPAVSSLGLFSAMATVALLVSLPLVAIEAWAGQLLWPSATGWLLIALAALLPSLIAQLTFIKGVELIGPGRAGIFVNLVPVFAAVFAVVFLQESFYRFHAFALILVLGGIVLAEHSNRALRSNQRS